MNKESKLYTILYIVVLVVVVGSALAFTAISLKDKQLANANADKMRQILASVRIEAPADSIVEYYDSYIRDPFVVDESGERIPGAVAFDIDVAAQSRMAADERQLPVYPCVLPDGSTKYILPLYGAGLWGPIWGYVSVDSDGSTIYGAYFAHQGETPGLGAEIAKPAFSDRFRGKTLFKNGTFLPVAVVKNGQRPNGNEDYVDGISGGTITSKGVGAMIDNCLSPYQNFLKTL
ncbi:MAG: NADH:ubiquinone reductase (Na(+)-transporting) subunit C [Muribaculaceae bacterium]|nr:NADH:ubiquinone reductase (Na(+)-transporting) subunit C [Muribaculaceae bacterium]